MITTPEEYYAYLSEIQSANPPSIAILPKAETVYEIDLATRAIETPEYLSVAKDHRSETVYFKIDRYFDYMDLAQTTCIVQYVTADGKARIYPVPFYDITTASDEDKMIFPWCIDGGATAVAGPIQYSVRFYKIDGIAQQFVYSLNTQPTTSKILEGMDVKQLTQDYDITYDTYLDILQKIDEVGDRKFVYWKDMYD
jgi:hypothetical protein